MSVEYDLVEINPGHYIKVLKCFSEKEKKAERSKRKDDKKTMFIIIPGMSSLNFIEKPKS